MEIPYVIYHIKACLDICEAICHFQYEQTEEYCYGLCEQEQTPSVHVYIKTSYVTRIKFWLTTDEYVVATGQKNLDHARSLIATIQHHYKLGPKFVVMLYGSDQRPGMV